MTILQQLHWFLAHCFSWLWSIIVKTHIRIEEMFKSLFLCNTKFWVFMYPKNVIVHSKMKIVFIYSPTCFYKPVLLTLKQRKIWKFLSTFCPSSESKRGLFFIMSLELWSGVNYDKNFIFGWTVPVSFIHAGSDFIARDHCNKTLYCFFFIKK